jgi:hypothetical protein
MRRDSQVKRRSMTEQHQRDERSADREPRAWWRTSEVEIEEFSGLTVAYLPEVDDAWISGWVEVPR